MTKSFLVTGASTGIGRACVVRLAASGHRLFAGVRKQDDADSLKEAGGDDVTPLMLDVTDAAAISAAAKAIDSVVGDAGLDGLVNNAGVALGGPLEYLPVETWRSQLEVNVVGQVAVTQAMMPLLRRATGRVVFIGSIGGRLGSAFLGPYNASKFALEGITEAFRQEVTQFGLKVILIEPGAIKTDIWDKGRSQVDDLERMLPKEARERYGPAVEAMRRLIDRQDRTGIPADRVARVVERALLSSSPRPRYLVGIDAQVGGTLARVVPDRVRDGVMRRFSGLG